MGGFWTGVAKGVKEQLSTAQGVDKEKALLILQGIIEGQVTPKENIAPAGIGRRIMSGLGIAPSAEADISRYNVMSNREAIVDATGKTIGYRPKGAVFRPKEETFSNIYEEGIKKKIAQGVELTSEEGNYYNKFMISSLFREPVEPRKSTPSYIPKDVQDWSQVPISRRIMSAFTPSATPEEQRLGGLRMGGILKPPQIQTQTNLRKQAIDALNSVGYPITENNIKSAIEQLRTK